MSIPMLKNYTVSKIEQSIPFPIGNRELLSLEQQQVLEMKEGDSFVLMVRFGGSSTDNAKLLVQWARTRGIRIVRRLVNHNLARIWRVAVDSGATVRPQNNHES